MSGRITEIRTSGGERPRLTVFVDGREAFTVSEEVAHELGLEVGGELAASDSERLEEDDLRERARETALRLLAVRARSVGELGDRLRGRGFPDDVASEVVAALVEVGLVDDLAFARAWADEKVRLKPVGPRRLESELMSKRVPKELIDRVVAQTFAEHTELELARRAVAKKRAPSAGPGGRKDRARLQSFLLRRGFSYEVAAAVIREMGGDTDA